MNCSRNVSGAVAPAVASFSMGWRLFRLFCRAFLVDHVGVVLHGAVVRFLAAFFGLLWLLQGLLLAL